MTAVFGEGRACEEANVGVYQSQVVVVGLGRRHDGSRIIVSVDAYTRAGVQSNSRRTCLSTDLARVACGAPDSCCLPLFSFGFQSSNAVGLKLLDGSLA